MLGSAGRRRSCPPPWSRLLALALLLSVGWSSVEVLRAEGTPAAAADLAATTAPATPTPTATPASATPTASAATAADEPRPDDDCFCFCACACQPVPVVLPALGQPAPDRFAPALAAAPLTGQPEQRAADPPYRPPRLPA